MKNYHKPKMMDSELYIVPRSFVFRNHDKVIKKEAVAYAVLRNLLDTEAFEGCSHRDEKGYYLLKPREKLVQIMGLSLRNVQRALSLLRERGLIETDRIYLGRGYGSCEYRTRLIDVE